MRKIHNIKNNVDKICYGSLAELNVNKNTFRISFFVFFLNPCSTRHFILLTFYMDIHRPIYILVSNSGLLCIE